MEESYVVEGSKNRLREDSKQSITFWVDMAREVLGEGFKLVKNDRYCVRFRGSVSLRWGRGT